MFLKNFLISIHALFIFLIIDIQSIAQQFTANITANPNMCNGSDASVTITNGTLPYIITYSLTGVQTITNQVTVQAPFTNPYLLHLVNNEGINVTCGILSVKDAGGNSAVLTGTNYFQVMPTPSGTFFNRPLAAGCTNVDSYINITAGFTPFTIGFKNLIDNSVIELNGIYSSTNFYTPAGNYQPVYLKDVNGCQSSLNIGNVLPAKNADLVISPSGSVTDACSVTLSVVNPGPIIYYWYRNNQLISTGSPLITATQTGDYYIKGVDPTTGCTKFSTSTNVTITNTAPLPPTPILTASPSSPYTCGQTVTLSVPSTPAYNIYTWRKNSTVIATTSSPTLNVTSTGYYDVQVGFTGACPSLFSQPLNLPFAAPPLTPPVISPGTNVALDCFQSTTLSVPAAYDTYQWYKNGNAISGANLSSYATNQPGSYSVSVSTIGNCGNIVMSPTTVVTVGPLASPILNKQGSISIPYNQGQNVLNVVSGTIYDSYQWQSSTNGSNYSDIAGATLSSYTFTVGFIYYRLKVTTGNCVAFSDFVYPQLSRLGTNVNSSNSPLIMCSSAGNLTAAPGFSYQWYKDNVLLPGETNATINVGNPVNGSGTYVVKYIDNNGLTYTTPSYKILVLADITPMVSIINPGCSGEIGSLSIAQPSTGTQGIYKHYTWTNSSGVTLFDFESLNLSTTAFINVGPGDYTLTVTDFAGCTSTQTVTVNANSTSPTFTPVIANVGSTSYCKPNRTSTTGIMLQVTNLSSLPPPSGTNVYFYQWMVDGATAPLPTYTGGGFPPASFFLGASQYNALNSGNYTLQIREEYNGFPLASKPAGWVSPKCFGISNAVHLDIDFTPYASFSVSSYKLCPNNDLTIQFNGQASANTVFTWDFGTPGDYTIISGAGAGPYVIRYSTLGDKFITMTLNNGICPPQNHTEIVSIVTTPIQIQTQQPSIFPGCASILQIYNIQTISDWSGGPFAVPAADLHGQTQAVAVPTQTTTYNVTGIDYNGCPTSGSITINVLPQPNTSFSYTPSTICQTANGLNPTFSVNAVNGHNFSVDKSGLVGFDTYNGTVYPNGSSANTYTITNKYSPPYQLGFACPVFTSTTQVTIVPTPVALDFNYPLYNYCSNAGIISPITSNNQPQGPGVYSFYPATGTNSPIDGLALNAVTGKINLANCSTGTYRVRFTTLGDPSCIQVYKETSITVTKYIDPTFSYPQTAYCNNVIGAQAIPDNPLNANVPGQFSINPYATINSQTGIIDLYNANPSTYQVTKTIYGQSACQTVSAIFTITINAPKAAAPISYVNSANAVVNSFCQGTAGTLSPKYGTPGISGTLSISPVPSQGWSSSGIDMSLLPAGQYTVTNTVTDVQCPNTSSSSVIITVKPKPVFTGSTQSICSGTNINIPLTSTPSGSSFAWTSTVTPAGSVNGASGGGGTTSISQYLALQYGLTTSGTVKYTVTPTLNQCDGNPADVIVTVNPIPSLTTTLSKTICSGNSVSIPLTTNVAGASTSWTASFISGTGVIGYTNGLGSTITDVLTGNGIVKYSVNSSLNNCSSSSDIQVTVNPTPAVTVTVPANICVGSQFTYSYTKPSGFTNTTLTNIPSSSISIASSTSSSTGGSYLLNGLSSNTPLGTDISLTITNPSTGCSTVTVKNVKINPVPVVSANSITICEGDGFSLPVNSTVSGSLISWTSSVTGNVSGFPVGASLVPIGPITSSTVTGSGTITYTITALANGCNSLPKVVTVTVNPNASSSLGVTPTTVCEGANLSAARTWPVGYSTVYTRPAGFNLLGGGGGSDGITAQVGESDIAGSTSGDFTFVVTSPQGCVRSHLVHVDVIPAPNVTASNITICEGAGFEIPLSSNNGVSYTWSKSSTTGTVGNYLTQGTSNPISAASVTGNGSITYKINSISANNCNSPNKFVTVTVNPNAPHVAGFYDLNSNPIVNGSSICQGGKIIFSANTPAGYSYTYTPPSSSDFQLYYAGQSSASFAKWYNVLGANDGIFTLSTVSDLGCTRTSQYTIHVNPAPSAPVIQITSSSPNAICSGSTGAYGYLIEDGIDYTFSSDPGLIVGGGRCAQNLTDYGCQAVWGNTGGFVYLTATNQAGCSTTSSQFVPIQPTPFIHESHIDTVCSGGNTFIALSSAPNSMNIKYEWQSFLISGSVNGKNQGEIVTSGIFYAPPGVGYTISENMIGNGILDYEITATSLNLDGCSSQTSVFLNVSNQCGHRMAASLSGYEPEKNPQAFPNPFSETIHVTIPASVGDEIELIVKDMKGIEVQRLKTNTGQADLGQHLESGVYILQVIGKSGSSTIKIVKTQ